MIRRRAAAVAALKGRPGIGFTVVAGLLSLALWWRVLIGHRVLVPGDVLYGLPPWSGSAGAHVPANAVLSDVVVQTLAWQTVVHQAFWHGSLPLWNPMALAGSPLLGNDQTGALFPLTLLTLPFSPAHAVSLVMIAKLWIAGLGAALFVRQLGAGGKAAFLGGLAFAASSYMTVWLGYPNSAVAALMPFGFATVEWYLRTRRLLALAVLAVDIGLMFLAGHVPSEAHLLGALAVYTAIRWSAPRPHRWRTAAGLIAAGLMGVLLGAVQLLPFAEALRNGVIFNLRLGQRAGEGHLALGSVASWLLPNSHGNPAIDGLLGRQPNYSEATGFAGVGVLLLAVLGVAWLWRRERTAAVGLVSLSIVAAGIVYGPLSPIAGRIPILEASNNARLIAFLCFAVSALGACGLEALSSASRGRSRSSGQAALVVGGLAMIALCGAFVLMYRRRGAIDSMLPAVHTHIGFWVAVAAMSLVAAVALIAAARWGGAPELASSGLIVLAFVEAMLFAWPYNPVTRLQDTPPSSQAMQWLRSHAGSSAVAALTPAMFPQSAALYGLRDVGGYDTITSARVVDYWTAADPGFKFVGNHTELRRPGVAWLAAAGVGQVLAPGNALVPGTKRTFTGEGVTIGTVPDVRPFAYAAPNIVVVRSSQEAAAAMKRDPLKVVAVEGGCCDGAQGTADVSVVERDGNAVKLRVSAATDTTVVVEQAYYPGWQASVDGRQADIRPANILFQSLRVPRGAHDVSLEYRPSSFTVGAAASGLGILAVALLIGLDRLSARKR